MNQVLGFGNPVQTGAMETWVPVHGGADRKRFETFIFPQSEEYVTREYQKNIVTKALIENTLVVLPTGLGKTFIAAVVMYNYLRWFSKGKVIFLAPTRPLVNQQIQACHDVVGIDEKETAEMNGQVSAAKRARLWKEKRVFYCTPQTAEKDLDNGIMPRDEICLVVVDEAHRAVGRYAFVNVVQNIQHSNKRFRVLALSATPGKDYAKVQEVVTNLLISNIEYKAESDPDVRPYVFQKMMDVVECQMNSDCQNLVNEFNKFIESPLRRLKNTKLFAALPGTARDLSHFQVIMAMNAIGTGLGANLDLNQMNMLRGELGLLSSLTHVRTLMVSHGISAAINHLRTHFEGDAKGQKRALVNSNEWKKFVVKLVEALQKGGVNPKIIKLKDILNDHFARYREAGRTTSVIVFAQYRDSVVEIVQDLRSDTSLRVSPFVGQAKGKSPDAIDDSTSTENGKRNTDKSSVINFSNRNGPFTTAPKQTLSSLLSTVANTRSDASKAASSAVANGQSQKEQQEVVRKFRAGQIDVLVATCIGEEGLDIGSVDLIVSYDALQSPVRMIQRFGRAGRKRAGRIIVLVADEREKDMLTRGTQMSASVHRLLREQSWKIRLYRSPPECCMFPDRSKRPIIEYRTLDIGEYRGEEVGGHSAKKRRRKPGVDGDADSDGDDDERNLLTTEELSYLNERFGSDAIDDLDLRDDEGEYPWTYKPSNTEALQCLRKPVLASYTSSSAKSEILRHLASETHLNRWSDNGSRHASQSSQAKPPDLDSCDDDEMLLSCTFRKSATGSSKRLESANSLENSLNKLCSDEGNTTNESKSSGPQLADNAHDMLDEENGTSHVKPQDEGLYSQNEDVPMPPPFFSQNDDVPLPPPVEMVSETSKCQGSDNTKESLFDASTPPPPLRRRGRVVLDSSAEKSQVNSMDNSMDNRESEIQSANNNVQPVGIVRRRLVSSAAKSTPESLATNHERVKEVQERRLKRRRRRERDLHTNAAGAYFDLEAQAEEESDDLMEDENEGSESDADLSSFIDDTTPRESQSSPTYHAISESPLDGLRLKPGRKTHLSDMPILSRALMKAAGSKPFRDEDLEKDANDPVVHWSQEDDEDDGMRSSDVTQTTSPGDILRRPVTTNARTDAATDVPSPQLCPKQQNHPTRTVRRVYDSEDDDNGVGSNAADTTVRGKIEAILPKIDPDCSILPMHKCFNQGQINVETDVPKTTQTAGVGATHTLKTMQKAQVNQISDPVAGNSVESNIVSNGGLTEEARRRIEENRLRAMARLQERNGSRIIPSSQPPLASAVSTGPAATIAHFPSAVAPPEPRFTTTVNDSSGTKLLSNSDQMLSGPALPSSSSTMRLPGRVMVVYNPRVLSIPSESQGGSSVLFVPIDDQALFGGAYAIVSTRLAVRIIEADEANVVAALNSSAAYIFARQPSVATMFRVKDKARAQTDTHLREIINQMRSRGESVFLISTALEARSAIAGLALREHRFGFAMASALLQNLDNVKLNAVLKENPSINLSIALRLASSRAVLAQFLQTKQFHNWGLNEMQRDSVERWLRLRGSQ